MFLPARSEARLNLAVTVLLGFIFIQTIVAGLMPKSNDWPFISKYVISSLVLSVFNLAACAVCVGIASLDRPENANPPLFLRWASYDLWHLRCCVKFCLRRSKTSLKQAKESTKAPEERDLKVLMVQLPTAEQNQGIEANRIYCKDKDTYHVTMGSARA